MLRHAPLAALACLVVAVAAMRAPHAAMGGTVHVVRLRDGSALASATVPLIAFGQVRYTDASGKLQILAGATVDVEATRHDPSNEGAPRPAGSYSVTGTVGTPDVMPLMRGVQPHVTMWSATWCGHCRDAKAWLSQNGVGYDLIEVDTLTGASRKDAEAKMKSMVGTVAFPLILVGDTPLLGFQQAQLTQLLGLAPRAMPSRTAKR